jgi:hypothetical protein
MVVALAGWINLAAGGHDRLPAGGSQSAEGADGKKRLRFSDDQRRRLVRKAKRIGFGRLK